MKRGDSCRISELGSLSATRRTRLGSRSIVRAFLRRTRAPEFSSPSLQSCRSTCGTGVSQLWPACTLISAIVLRIRQGREEGTARSLLPPRLGTGLDDEREGESSLFENGDRECAPLALWRVPRRARRLLLVHFVQQVARQARAADADQRNVDDRPSMSRARTGRRGRTRVRRRRRR